MSDACAELEKKGVFSNHTTMTLLSFTKHHPRFSHCICAATVGVAWDYDVDDDDPTLTDFETIVVMVMKLFHAAHLAAREVDKNVEDCLFCIDGCAWYKLVGHEEWCTAMTRQ